MCAQHKTSKDSSSPLQQLSTFSSPLVSLPSFFSFLIIFILVFCVLCSSLTPVSASPLVEAPGPGEAIRADGKEWQISALTMKSLSTKMAVPVEIEAFEETEGKIQKTQTL